MKLTGKCLQEFEKWFQNISETHYRLIEWFESLDDNMQIGVYEDYFDSVGIIMYTGKSLSGYNYYVTITHKFYQSKSAKTLQEARTAAIKKANEIRNEQLNKK